MKRKPTTAQIAKHAADRAWYKHAQNRLKQAKQTIEALDSTGTYQGYSADAGTHEIKTTSGRVIDARIITSAGLDAGDRGALVGNDSSGYWFKSTPRV